MIGGEAAEWTALERRPVADAGAADERDPYGLGWVTDWLYGDAVLPPMPLSRDPEPDLPWRRAGYSRAPEITPRSRRRRRARQLALL
jgi:hypothetical protein